MKIFCTWMCGDQISLAQHSWDLTKGRYSVRLALTSVKRGHVLRSNPNNFLAFDVI